MLPRPSRLPAATLLLAACAAPDWPEPPPVELEAYHADHEEWRSNREERVVTPPGGAALWIGLHELAPGATPFGSDSSLPIVLSAEDAPALAGTLHRAGLEITLEPAPGAPVRIHEGAAITERMLLRNDRQEEYTRMQLGSLGMRIHSEPGTDRLWLRVWDEDHPLRETFQLPDYYPVDPEWRVTARFEAYDEPIALESPDVTGGTVVQQSPGELVFRHAGREHRLIAVAGATSRSYFLMVWDSTATVDTYQAGRYLRAPIADSLGWTEIDFNRTYNAPCVFTAFSVCSLPPRQNWLPFHVSAGEKRPAVPAY